MEARAQSNTQLFLQLHQAGASEAALRQVRDAYLLAMQLYSGLFTGCGRPILTHEVGTASLIHRFGGSSDLIAAAQLHGAYLVGDWGGFRIRITARKRAALRAIIGEQAERYVHGFARQPWTAPDIFSLASRVNELDAFDRDVIFLRLVEDLERLQDYGAILCFRDPEAMKARYESTGDPMCRMAEHLGHPALSAALADAVAATLAAEPPAEIMRLRFPGDRRFRITPPSYRRRLELRIYQAIAGRGRRIERALRDWMAASTAGAAGRRLGQS